jgi:hypothetical protein
MDVYGFEYPDDEDNLDVLIRQKRCAIDMKYDNRNEVHTALHKDMKFTLNSINVLVGQAGAGKTLEVLTEVGKLSWIEHPYHQLVYVNKDDGHNDMTFQKFKDLVKIPIVKIKYDQALEYLTKLIKFRNHYDNIQTRDKWKEKNGDEATVNGIEPPTYTDELRKACLKLLTMKDFSLEFPHTIILYDDVTEMLKKKANKELSLMILRNRHFRFTYFLNIHDFNKNSIPMEIKNSINALWYFGGFSEQNFNAFFKQFKSPVPQKKLFQVYARLGRNDYLYFAYTQKGTIIKDNYNNIISS